MISGLRALLRMFSPALSNKYVSQPSCNSRWSVLHFTVRSGSPVAPAPLKLRSRSKIMSHYQQFRLPQGFARTPLSIFHMSGWNSAESRLNSDPFQSIDSFFSLRVCRQLGLFLPRRSQSRGGVTTSTVLTLFRDNRDGSMLQVMVSTTRSNSTTSGRE